MPAQRTVRSVSSLKTIPPSFDTASQVERTLSSVQLSNATVALRPSSRNAAFMRMKPVSHRFHGDGGGTDNALKVHDLNEAVP